MDDRTDNMSRALLDGIVALYDSKPSDLVDDIPPAFENLHPAALEYEIRGTIARGGMKTIYHAFAPRTGRDVALARLHSDSPRELFEPFVSEARLTALLDHPNIITIYDIGLDEESVPYFTMELKSGQSLAGMFNDECLMMNRGSDSQCLSVSVSVNDLLGIFLKVCDAVSYAHSRNVIHLDLKPDNIQVGVHGEVIVCDWGLGKVLDNPEFHSEFDRLLLNQELLGDITLSGNIKGTPGYMAPEQIRVDGEKTFQTDIYALGAILYTLLTGKCTVSGDTKTMLNKTLAGDLISPAAYSDSTIPSALSAVAMKALAVNPAVRYQTVEHLQTDVHNYLCGYATSAENAGALRELKLLYKRNTAVCNTVFVFGLLLTASISIFVYNLNNSMVEADQARRTAEAERANSEMIRDQLGESLELYRAEKRKIELMEQGRSRELLEDIHEYRYNLFYTDPEKRIRESIAAMEKALALDPMNAEANRVMGQLYIAIQRFGKANSYYDVYHGDSKDLYQASREFVHKEKNSDGLLRIEELPRLLHAIGQGDNPRSPLSERIIAYDMLKRQGDHNYGPSVKELLRNRNKLVMKQVCDFSFDYDAAKKHVSIHGESLKTLRGDDWLASGKCLLRFLHIEHLDISNTSFYDLNDIKELIHVKTLDVRRTLVTDLEPLGNLPALSRLIIAEDQFSKEKLAKLHPNVQIKVK